MSKYTHHYYHKRRAGSLASARQIVPLVLELCQPKSVIDVGCGTATWLSVFMEHGVTDCCGVDGGYVERERLEIPEERFIPFDLQQPLDMGRRFDLAVSLEVAEHLPRECAEVFVASLTKLAPTVLFSAAIPFQGGRGHVNEQWPDYWADLFASRGYQVIDCIRRHVWAHAEVPYWYAQNTLLYVEQACLDRNPLLKEAAETSEGSPLAVVHPTKYLEFVDWALGRDGSR